MREKDKEAKVESRESIIKETKMALAKQVAMQETLREAEAEAQAEADSNSDVPVPGAGAGAAGTVPPDMLPSAATATGSDEDEDDEDEERGVIPQDRIGSITSDVLSGATNQLLQVRTLHARLKSQKELAEESRQRASAQKLEEKRQADLIARVSIYTEYPIVFSLLLMMCTHSFFLGSLTSDSFLSCFVYLSAKRQTINTLLNKHTRILCPFTTLHYFVFMIRQPI